MSDTILLTNFTLETYVMLGKSGEQSEIGILMYMIKNHSWNMDHLIELVSYDYETEHYIREHFTQVCDDVNFYDEASLHTRQQTIEKIVNGD
jgi:hypothetical protein